MDSSTNISQFYYKNNRLQQIRGFCNTVTYGSLSKAAKIMNLSQSSISLQIKTLERDLNTILLKRSKKNGKRFELTEDGKILYEMGMEVVNGADGLCDKFLLRSTKHHNSVLKIAGHHSVFSILIPKALKKIKNSTPDLRLQLSYLTRQEACEKIEQGEVDVAIYPLEDLTLIQKNLSYQKISDYKPALITPIGHPLSLFPDKKITFEEIGKYNYIHTGSYAISDIMKYNIASKVLNSDIDLNHGSWDILKALVAAGLGVTIFHEDYCKDAKNIVIKKVRHLSPDIAYYAIFKGGVEPKKLVSELVGMISSQSVKIV
ncbi:MAG: LysR family transcriptional regulator [Proteobacteria bacterium]|nr:LysR family transcriptional regulator [Pseudomonadota bacterium]